MDKQTSKVYKAYQRKVNELYYWIAFALVLACLRGIDHIYLTLLNEFYMTLLIVIGLAISFGTGVYYYKKLTYEPLMEVYLTDDMINDYIIAGKNGFKIEVGIAIIIVCLFVLAFVLFIVFRWLMCFLISLFLFALLGMLFGSITIERFKLYQKRKSV